jgi:hypothetical protein
MTDPHLTSCRLAPCRRDEFHRAREALLEAWQCRTQEPEQGGRSAGGKSHAHEQLPTTADYWLIDEGKTYPLRPGVNTIGRLADNDVVIKGPYVSRRHCAILVDGVIGCELRDVASRNGTYVNGFKVDGSKHLASGDEILICDRRLVIRSKDHSNTLT